jgi:UDP-glucose 6-dehydrogenase
MKIGIVGHGFVGKALEAGFKHAHELFIYDKFKDTLSLKEVLEQSDTIFFCLPTPFNEETMHIRCARNNKKLSGKISKQ